MIVKKYLTHNGNLIQRGTNKFIYRNYDEPEPVFPSVQIGNQIWMSENLQVDDGGEGIQVIQSVIANGYEFGPQTYYTAEAAIRVASNIEGWHLPTPQEFDILKTYMESQGYTDTKPLRINYGWSVNQGTNETNLSVLPIGAIRTVYPNKGNPVAVGDECSLRTNYINGTNSTVNFMYGNYIGGFSNFTYTWPANYYIAARLIKDND